MLLNCDLGESFGNWKMGLDDQVMPFIDQANIACGFHAGDPDVMHRTLLLAKQNQVSIGAHPAYLDLQGFGRRSMQLTRQEIINLLHYQIGALSAMATVHGMQLSYVKPHGALYNDMMAKPAVFDAVVEAIDSFPHKLKLMILATAESEQYQKAAGQVALLFEAFADRRYQDNGHLTPRSQPDAVLDTEQTLQQVKLLAAEGTVITQSGRKLALNPDTLCVHGDNPHALAMVRQIRDLLPR
ncbi:5-oxoprolinase subunit PxpA [Bowmanella sp. Y26]|uniref:5-oxoprolinase subunit PxpA n=1 Tax=Bowmanella yangjiangensis TaxID=2811230 RepID=UPI001BDC3DEE|nr:5-oxoprolinase subunit PxpA [Bowmanella yangjiangensis]MBT1064599.1 5-oxoprolinase subunit PxpA [Bowmanella yangjiangensis]